MVEKLKKIGYFDADVVTPEEIVIAAGFTPVRLLGDPTIELDKANEHVPPNHCVWARNILEQAMKSLDSEISGVITSHGCDCTNREFDIWLECINLDFMFFLNVPLKRNDIGIKFFINDIKELITQLEEKFNVTITDEKLKEAIKKMNKIRSLLKEISEFRYSFILKGSEFHELVKQVQQNDKDIALKTLKTKLNELKNRDKFSENGLKKILLTGSEIDDTEFIKFLERLKLHVVIDDLGVGTRYFWNNIDESEDPIKAIAKYHLTKPVFSTKFPSYKRFDFIKELAQTYRVDGIINIAAKFCEPILYDHPFMNMKFKKLEIPYLFIETEYNRESYSQLTTRFEAFAEIL
ncbi:MAG: 2-hydroxyacyl-CoA dehydratase subunit D [Promethearchaeota archaeon]